MTPRVSLLDGIGDTVRTLLTTMAGDSSGAFAPSVYETGRVVAHAPSLTGHEQRIRYLLGTQRADGLWGGPGDYDIVPSLSATEALLTERGRPGADPRAARAAEHGVRALAARLGPATTLPDTVAVEVIVPALVDDVNAHLARQGTRPLDLPEAARADLLDTLRSAVAQGYPLPDKLLHSLEIIGNSATGADFVEPWAGRIVGCSPAATAVWLGDERVHAGSHPCVDYLRSVRHHNGGIPVAAPLALFERAWVLSTLVDAGVPLDVPRDVLDTLRASLHEALGDEGAAGGLGLPPDVDDTGTALHALALLGDARSAECLWQYHAGDHFVCFPEERTPSTSANAHVLQALGATLSASPPEATAAPDRTRYAEAARAVTRWLGEQQHPDGSWTDKWHASPYYATMCTATALAHHGAGQADSSIAAAVDWVLATQRADGSWGHWSGTREETAYAVRTLLRSGRARNGSVARAAARGADYLLDHTGHGRHADRSGHAEVDRAQVARADPGHIGDEPGIAGTDPAYPALWHDKDLYTPTRIVDSEILAALHLAHTDPHTAELLAEGSRAAMGVS